MSIGTLCKHGCEATFNDKSVHIKNKQGGRTITRVTRYARTNLYMLSLTQKNNLMTESNNPDDNFSGSAYDCKSKNTLVDYHHTYCWSPTQSGWEKAITKNFFASWTGLSVDLAHKHLKKNNQPYLGTSSNRRRASDPHKKRSCILTHIQSMTSSLKPHSQKTPILYFSRQLICPRNFIQIKQEGSQSLEARVISISSLLTTLTQTQSMLNPSRQYQA